MTYLSWLRTQNPIPSTWREEAQHRLTMEQHHRLMKQRSEELNELEELNEDEPHLWKGIVCGLVLSVVLVVLCGVLVIVWESLPRSVCGVAVAGILMILWVKGVFRREQNYR